jgi:hypothetical protein
MWLIIEMSLFFAFVCISMVRGIALENFFKYRVYKKHQNLGDFLHVFSTRKFFLKNHPIWADFMRGIDCAFLRSLTTLPWAK